MSVFIRTKIGFIWSGDMVIHADEIKGISDDQILKCVHEMESIIDSERFRKMSPCSDHFNSVDDWYAEMPRPKPPIIVDEKALAMSRRRARFDYLKPAIRKVLIERDGYICNADGCMVAQNLDIDHIIPISKSGTDDLKNLQFLCKRHNSIKGQRITCEQPE